MTNFVLSFYPATATMIHTKTLIPSKHKCFLPTALIIDFHGYAILLGPQLD